MYDFGEFKQKIKEKEEWLKKELSGIQTGRATPNILDSILVTSYGSRLPINQLAGITLEDARTLRIAPWNLDTLRDIEVAINDADLGLSVAADDRGIRVSFPELTGERREKLAKVVNSKVEEARISLRAERDKVWQDIQKKEREGEIGEDDKFRFKEEMEKLTKEANETLDRMAERKEKEIRGED